MNEPAPFPTSVAPPRTLIPTLSDKTSVLVGGPLAGMGAYLWVDVMKLDPSHLTQADIAIAASAGGIFAAVTGYLWHAATVLIDRWVARA